jgi:hypothetical protein
MEIDSDVPARHRHRVCRVLFATAVAAASLTFVAAAPSGIATATAVGQVLRTTPPDTTPVTTPDTTPVTTPDTDPNGGGGDDSDVPWPLIIAIGAVAIAVIALIATATGRRRTTTTSAAAPPRAKTADQDRGYALGSAQWVHDHLAPELLAAPPAEAAQRWRIERGRLDDAVIRAQQYSSDPTTGVAWQQLGQSLSLLGTSLDSYIHLRNQQPPNQPQIDESYAVAYQHHAELGVALSQVWPTIQR